MAFNYHWVHNMKLLKVYQQFYLFKLNKNLQRERYDSDKQPLNKYVIRISLRKTQ